MLKAKSFLIILVTGFLSAGLLNAEESPFQFLRYQSSARSAALAGCFVSMPGDPGAVIFNPASIYTVKEKKFSATFLKHVLDINSGLVSYVHRDEEFGVLAGSISYTNYGSFERADAFGNPTGTFGANDLSLAASYSNILDTNLYYGVTLKLLYVNLEKQNAIAMAVDAGILYQLPDNRTNIGVSILHAGTTLSNIGGESESLPLDIRAGINHRLKGLPLLVNFTLHHLADDDEDFLKRFQNFAIAGELYLGKYIMARLGYDNQVRRLTSSSSDRKLAGFSAGLGIKLTDFNFDYGIAQYGSAATLHRFSIGMDF